MNSKFIIANTLLAITFLMSSLRVSGMENESKLLDVSCDRSSLKNMMKDILSLSATCKRFNTEKDLHIAFGKYCKDRYPIAEKNELMRSLSWKVYSHIRCAAFTLVYAGADNKVNDYDTFLARAIDEKDGEMISALFKNGVHPNQRLCPYSIPDWFRIKDGDIVKIFVDQKTFNLHEQTSEYQNVLWYVIETNPSSELIETYLNYGVDVKRKKILSDGYHIWHHLLKHIWWSSGVDEYKKIVKSLLKVASDSINTRHKGKTPLSVAYEMITKDGVNKETREVLRAIISLLEQNGAKTF